MKFKKILLLFLIFIFLILLSGSVNATTTFICNYSGSSYYNKEITLPDISTIPEQYHNYLDLDYFIRYYDGYYYLHFLKSDSYLYVYNSTNLRHENLNSSYASYMFSCTSSDSSWGGFSNSYRSEILNNQIIYLNATIYSDKDKSEIIFEPVEENPITSFPYIMNKDSDLAKGNSDIIIMPEQFSNTDNIRFCIQKITEFTDDTGIYETYIDCFDPIVLNSSSEYYVQVGDTGLGFYYKIPWSFIEEYLEEGSKYSFVLAYNANNEDFRVDKVVEYVGLSSTDIYNSISSDIKNTTNTIVATINQSNENLQNSIEQQTEVQEEQLETSKGIWASIKEVISYINPFSENFFVYKLIDLLIDALKSLFVPGADFFNAWISDMNEYFGNRFGLLYYPIEIVVEFLTRLYNISSSLDSGFVLSFPDLKLFDVVLINGFSFDFNTLLENETFKNVYDIYLICVDVVLILGLVVLCKNTFVDIFGGKFVDDVVHAAYSDEVSYSKYARYQRNVERYKKGGQQ